MRAAVGRIEVGCGCGVYARAGGGKEAAVVRQRERTVEARPVETSESRAVVVDAVEVVVVGIFILVVTRGHEIYDLADVVRGGDLAYVPVARGYGVAQLALLGVEVEVRPARALRPLDKVRAAVDQMRIARLDRGVHLLAHHGAACVGADLYGTEVDALYVAALSEEVEAVVVAEPYAALRLFVCVGVARIARTYPYGLVLELADLDLAARQITHVEEFEVRRGALLAGHLVLIALQLGARLREYVDDPQVFEARYVVAHDGEAPRVGRPVERYAVTLGGVDLLDAVLIPAVREVGRAVARQTMFDDGRVLGILAQLLDILARHVPQVIALLVYGRAAVGR